MKEIYEEYQGFSDLYIAEITKDDLEGYTTGAPEVLAPAGEITKSTATDSAVKYYDNQPYFTSNSEGSDEIQLIVPILPISKLAKITGKTIDAETGTLLDDGEAKTKYFALLYKLMFQDGTYRWVCRSKGSFAVGDESSKSKDDSTDTNNQTLTFTGIATVHKFDKTGKPSKAIIADDHDELCDTSTWYTEVPTPDNIKAKISV